MQELTVGGAATLSRARQNAAKAEDRQIAGASTPNTAAPATFDPTETAGIPQSNPFGQPTAAPFASASAVLLAEPNASRLIVDEKWVVAIFVSY